MSIEGTVGGSQEGPTADAEGIPLKGQERDNDGNLLQAGDSVVIIHMDDPNLNYYVGKTAECEQVQDVFPFSQVFLVFADGTPALSTFSAWVRKVS